MALPPGRAFFLPSSAAFVANTYSNNKLSSARVSPAFQHIPGITNRQSATFKSPGFTISWH